MPANTACTLSSLCSPALQRTQCGASVAGRTARTPLRLAPQACGVTGQAGWILTAKMAFFVTLGFVRFVRESRPSSRRYPTSLRFGDDVLYRMISRAVGRKYE